MAQTFNPGDKVTYGEFDATVIRHYHEGMYEIRVPGGESCVDGADLKLVQRAAYRKDWRAELAAWRAANAT